MKKYFYTISSFALLSTPVYVFGQPTTQTMGGPGAGTPAPVNFNVTIHNPLNSSYTSITAVITAVLQKIVMPLAAVFVVLAIIYSGFKYVMAQGNPKEIQDANKGLLYVLIGTAVLLGATGISAALQGTLCHIFTSISCS